MSGYSEKIQALSAALLQQCRVDVVIGFRKGSQPMMNEPCLVTTPEGVRQLVWDSNCGINLANYLANRQDKIGVVAKGCDTRNIVTLIIENKIRRDQLVIIGVPCLGMVDKRQIAARFSDEIEAVAEDGERLMVTAGGQTTPLAKADVLQANCRVCRHRNPVLYDELVADPVPEQTDVDRYADVRAIEALSPDQKWAYFENLLATCLRCYACRNACPLCYCPTCFVDESKPQWVGKGQDMTDIRTFHFLRAYHCAGRCTDCGACERACPVGINMRVFTKKLEMDCYQKFGWEAGLTLDARPPLDTYRPEDPDDFIR